MFTWHELANPGEELGAASVTVNCALNEEAVLGVSRTDQGQEAEGRGSDDGVLGHCESCFLFLFFFFYGDYLVSEEGITFKWQRGSILYPKMFHLILALSLNLEVLISPLFFWWLKLLFWPRFSLFQSLLPNNLFLHVHWKMPLLLWKNNALLNSKKM